LQPTSPQPQQPDALLTEDANHPKGAGQETPRHLPAEAENSEDLNEFEASPTLNGMFTLPHTNGHAEPTMTI
jgi:hypothetical protein